MTFVFIALSTLPWKHHKVFQVFYVCYSDFIIALIYFRLMHRNCQSLVREWCVTKKGDICASYTEGVSPWENNTCCRTWALLCQAHKTLMLLLQRVSLLWSLIQCLIQFNSVFTYALLSLWGMAVVGTFFCPALWERPKAISEIIEYSCYLHLMRMLVNWCLGGFSHL